MPLEPPSSTRVVRVRKGVRATTDGPYSEAKEQLAGVFIIDVATPERAEEIAATIPEAQFVAVEVRPALGLRLTDQPGVVLPGREGGVEGAEGQPGGAADPVPGGQDLTGEVLMDGLPDQPADR